MALRTIRTDDEPCLYKICKPVEKFDARLSLKQGRAVFLGDTEPEAHAAILRSADVRADVVKVPHHGSAQFLAGLPRAVSARIALVGVGAANPFGHPAAQTLQAWQQSGATVYTTEMNGDIAITSDRAVAVRGRPR